MRRAVSVVAGLAVLVAPVAAVESEAAVACEVLPDRVEVPGHHLDAYFESKPNRFLVDPQRLLGRADAREREEFLDYHSGDSAIDLYVYLLKADQELPAGRDAEQLVDRVFAGGRPAVVVHYYLGAPERAAIFLSPALDPVVSLAEQARALETAIERALQDATPSKQFERFIIQMSIRIYWMERLLERGVSVDQQQAEEIQPKPESEREEALSNKQRLLRLAEEYAVPAASGAGLLAMLALIRWRIRRRARYRFEDLEVEERLGGPHAAGIGAVVSFSSADLSPASQRDAG